MQIGALAGYGVWLLAFTSIVILLCFVTCKYKSILCQVCVRTKHISELKKDDSEDSGFGGDTARDHTQRLPQVDETPVRVPP